MTTIHDLRPAATLLGELVGGVGDDQLGLPTPCPDYTLGDLLDHVNGLSLAFTWAATKDERIAASGAPTADAARLGDDWRTRIPAQLATLGEAWRLGRRPRRWTAVRPGRAERRAVHGVREDVPARGRRGVRPPGVGATSGGAARPPDRAHRPPTLVDRGVTLADLPQ